MRLLRHLPAACVAFALTGMLAGCASVGAPVPPSLELPKPPTDLRAVRKGNNVYLFWTVPTRTTDRQTVHRPGPTRICRSLAAVMNECDAPVGNVSPLVGAESGPGTQTKPGQRPQAQFADTLPPELQQQNPTHVVTYAVEALNRNARSAGLSNQVQVALAPTLPPPSDFQAQVTSEGVLLSWKCGQLLTASIRLRYRYRIYRRSADGSADAKLADVECTQMHYEDRATEWQKSYEYRINAITEVQLDESVVEVEGDDSAPRKVFTNDIYPPGVPSGVQAVFSGPGQPPFVDLLWAPDTDADLAGYNIYRRDEATQPLKMNDTLVKTPAFRDANVTPGKTYWYSVSAVDLRANESARSDEAAEAVPQN